ncbi:hypothetical protein FOXG_02884 [Fusarium oxysporum f. sp. lycopersici 4287]|uniref:Carrier domain-containing protein n=2 Tax=Fusarium oxysporum TaxID=5507 RepID=A0A0J9UGK0_FUSO4|nr:hypothetical protein FOXG_02884 [Fusarium oxysporum f. sp. lycopersici 4287]KNA98553.1 hypothetical protein FOXG_02884 [Fusarium oxysporum f. sp. lycopersici 4287]
MPHFRESSSSSSTTGCRLPGDVSSPSDFWKLMMEKRSGQTPKVPASRFNIDAHFHPNNDRPGSFGVLGGYFLNETLQEFDPGFFGITPVEATWMDPQQRKLLEVVYEAFESAGLTLDQLSGSDTACFMATFTADFQQMSFKEPSFRHSLAATGVDPGLLSNRVSHVFNLRGPSIVVNTACSSSVYALHNACNALRTHECSAAVVGGSNLILTVDQHMNTAKLGVLSPTSTCHTFNSYANGYGRAEGVGAIYLKRLSDAVRDGDPIRGVIRSTQRTGPMLTGYFDCHGTGTAIGDPLEVHAVSDIMNTTRTDADGPLNIGAVKTNIGYSGAASGLSAVIKAILMVERGIIPPTHGVTELNPRIDWKGWRVHVPTEATPMPRHLPVMRVFDARPEHEDQVGTRSNQSKPAIPAGVFSPRRWSSEAQCHSSWQGCRQTLEECLLENQATSRVGEAEFSQPLCTAVQVALVQLLKVWGVHPSVTIGHSSGEIAAAFTAGYISEAEAILAAYYRGQAVKCIDSAGAMMAVGIGAEAITLCLEAHQPRVAIACHNSPEGVTLSGDVEVLKVLEADLKAEGTFARILHTNGKAYHSHHMLSAVDRYEGLLRDSRENGLPRLMFDKTKMVSSVTNSFLKENTVLDEKYWSANLTNTVLFNQAVQTALAHHLATRSSHCGSSPSQWDKAKKFWAESRESKEHHSPRFPRHDILGQLTIGSSLKEPTWRNVLRLKDLPWLRDHSLGGEAVFPAAGYLSMAMEAITQLNEMSEAPLEIDSYIFRDISIQQALVTPDDDDGIETLFNMRPSRLSTDETMRWWDFNTSSISTEGHVKNHMTGRILINTNKRRALARTVPNLPQRASGKLWNQALKKVGFNYGPTFQDMDNITFDGISYCAQATTNIKTSAMKDESRHVLHPAILDSCLQLMIVAIWAGRASAMKFGAVPVTAEEIVVWKPTQAQLDGSSSAKAFSWIDPPHIVSKPDFLLLRGSQSHLSLVDFIELAHFKNPALKVLTSDTATATAFLARLPKPCLTVATDATHTSDVTAELSSFTTVSVEPLVLTADLTAQSQQKLKCSFDIIAAPSTSLHELRISPNFSQKTVAPCVYGLERELEKVGFKTERLRLGETCPAGANVIALVDLEAPFMARMSKDEFSHIQKILSEVSKVLWMSCSDASKDTTRSEYAMTAGLLRSLRSERASLKATLVDFSIDDLASDAFGTRTSDLASVFFTGEQELETEYISKDGQLLINRLVPFDRINERYALTDEETQSQPFDPEARLDGKIDSGKVVFSHCNADGAALKPTEVEFRVIATGLTDEDKAVISGSSPGPDFSHEASGIVTRIGNAVTRVSPGDRMVTFSAGTLSSFQRVSEYLVQKLHDSEDHEATAGLPMYYGPALYGLETLAKLEPNESVLVLPGSGILGGAAIRVTQALGGRFYVAVRNDTEAEEVQSSFGLSRDQILVDYTPELLHEYEIDVVFSGSSVEPAISQESWRNMPALSRFVNCGKMPVGSSLDSASASRGASYLPVNLIGLFKRPQVLGRLLERIMRLHRDGLLPVPPLTVSSISDINSSIVLSSALNSSETTITHTKGSTVDVTRTPPRLELHSDATYLLVGCLGGLGRSLTTWMMKRGERNFAFLSRSGTDSEQAALCVRDLEARGALVQVFRGDAAIKEDVERGVASIPSDKPLRGIVNAAMVLRDGLFQNMSYESWTRSIQPKVLGSKNLHGATANLPLDFFLMTSSVSGSLGTPAQGNYAAANSYMDALARLRRPQGKPACAVILPMVLGVGVVAENLDLENSLTRKGMYGIDEEALLDAFEVSILEQQRPQDDGASFDHLVVGLDPAELHRARKQADGDVDAFWAADQRFSILLDSMNQLDGANQGDGEAGSILSRVKAADSPAQAASLVRDHFIAKLARVLLLDVEEFSDESSGRSIASYGIDSMIGAELRNWIFKELGLDVAFQQLLSPSLTIPKFAELICVSQGIFVNAE